MTDFNMKSKDELGVLTLQELEEELAKVNEVSILLNDKKDKLTAEKASIIAITGDLNKRLTELNGEIAKAQPASNESNEQKTNLTAATAKVIAITKLLKDKEEKLKEIDKNRMQTYNNIQSLIHYKSNLNTAILKKTTSVITGLQKKRNLAEKPKTNFDLAFFDYAIACVLANRETDGFSSLNYLGNRKTLTAGAFTLLNDSETGSKPNDANSDPKSNQQSNAFVNFEQELALVKQFIKNDPSRFFMNFVALKDTYIGKKIFDNLVCYLPYFDTETLKKVEKTLKNLNQKTIRKNDPTIQTKDAKKFATFFKEINTTVANIAKTKKEVANNYEGGQYHPNLSSKKFESPENDKLRALQMTNWTYNETVNAKTYGHFGQESEIALEKLDQSTNESDENNNSSSTEQAPIYGNSMPFFNDIGRSIEAIGIDGKKIDFSSAFDPKFSPKQKEIQVKKILKEKLQINDDDINTLNNTYGQGVLSFLSDVAKYATSASTSVQCDTQATAITLYKKDGKLCLTAIANSYLVRNLADGASQATTTLPGSAGIRYEVIPKKGLFLADTWASNSVISKFFYKGNNEFTVTQNDILRASIEEAVRQENKDGKNELTKKPSRFNILTKLKNLFRKPSTDATIKRLKEMDIEKRHPNPEHKSKWSIFGRIRHKVQPAIVVSDTNISTTNSSLPSSSREPNLTLSPQKSESLPSTFSKFTGSEISESDLLDIDSFIEIQPSPDDDVALDSERKESPALKELSNFENTATLNDSSGNPYSFSIVGSPNNTNVKKDEDSFSLTPSQTSESSENSLSSSRTSAEFTLPLSTASSDAEERPSEETVIVNDTFGNSYAFTIIPSLTKGAAASKSKEVESPSTPPERENVGSVMAKSQNNEALAQPAQSTLSWIKSESQIVDTKAPIVDDSTNSDTRTYEQQPSM